MIRNLIFDFGDVFINLDKQATVRLLSQKFGDFDITPALKDSLDNYEKGLITTSDFVALFRIQFPKASNAELIDSWNAIILDFPEYRLQFIENLAKSKKYRLFLLSNTNELHIQKVIENMGEGRYERFKNCFERFYLSHEINLRKPDLEIYQFVLEENKLLPHETFFVDDTEENTNFASELGIKTWCLKPGNDDVTQLFESNFI